MRKILSILIFIFSLVLFQQQSFALDGATPSPLQENTVNSQLLKDQGTSFYKEGKYFEALNCFEKLDKKSLNAEIYMLIANCYDSIGNPQKASEYLIKSIEYNPENSSPYYNLGILQFKINNINGAIDNFKKAINYNKSFTAAYYNLGVCYFNTHDFKKAKDSFTSALKLDSDSESICYGLVLTYNALNDTKMAEKYLDIYSKLSEKKKEGYVTPKTPDNNVKSDITPPEQPSEKPVSNKQPKSFWHKLNFLDRKN